MKFKDLLGMDYFLLVSTLLLTLMGILFIYSSGVNADGVLVSAEYIRQIIWACGGFVVILALAAVNYRRLYDLSPYFYAAILILLLFTVFFGRYINGARRGIEIGMFSFQPAEFSKIITIIFLARYLESTKRERDSLFHFLVSCIIVFVPMGIVLLQPDLGTALVYIPILLVMLFISGYTARYIMFLVGFVVATIVLTLLPYWEQYIIKGTHLYFSLL
ncbi:MAG: FtsW/RodA/SpoVE family cell cycle protein, partial [Treponema sp.]|nr:FtsW/RodA/SpoVE family cell cycle protein [Treponema sp.]